MLYKINPDRNKPWNDLPLLPIDESLFTTIDILKLLGETKAALGKLQGRSITIPNQAMLINTISLQEAKDSSAIENIFTTDDELYKAYSERNIDEAHGSSKEVLRYREALWTGYEYLSDKAGFDQNYFIKIFREIKQTGDGIRPSHVPIVIKQGGREINSGIVVFTPPRGKKIIESLLINLLEFMNDDDKYPIDPIIKMIIGHYQFETIHPFRDGNGRTGRIFNIHYLTKKGLLDYPILYLSRYIINTKNDYYFHLSNVSKTGNWKNWTIYMLNAIKTTASLTYNKINEIIELKDSIIEVLDKSKDIKRPEKIVDMIFQQPFTKVKHLTENGLFAENTARLYLNKLCEYGILEKKTIQGHHYYLNIDLSRILAE
ncbi:Fic family protein [Bacteroidota bacterium]